MNDRGTNARNQLDKVVRTSDLSGSKRTDSHESNRETVGQGGHPGGFYPKRTGSKIVRGENLPQGDSWGVPLGKLQSTMDPYRFKNCGAVVRSKILAGYTIALAIVVFILPIVGN